MVEGVEFSKFFARNGSRTPKNEKQRELYDLWLENGTHTYTKYGNLRAPSKMELCDMVVEAWETITKDTIVKSFKCCGQSKDARPEDITCLKEGRKVENALSEVTELWDKDPKSITVKNIDDVPDESEHLLNEFVIDDD